MGHSAKYGVYSVFCCNKPPITHFDLVQVSSSEPFLVVLISPFHHIVVRRIDFYSVLNALF